MRGEGSVPQSQEVRNKFINGTGTAEDRISRLVPLFFPQEWRNENPNYLENIPKTKETILNQTLTKQIEAATNVSSNWNRVKNITHPTLVIVGTDDVATPAPNSLRMAELIPGARFVPIKGGGHGLMYQYPEQFSNIVDTFLENTNTSRLGITFSDSFFSCASNLAPPTDLLHESILNPLHT
ncbi:MAG: alpha/beta fold hydrolase, partial [Nitrososphaeraceae archaeon]